MTDIELMADQHDDAREILDRWYAEDDSDDTGAEALTGFEGDYEAEMFHEEYPW